MKVKIIFVFYKHEYILLFSESGLTSLISEFKNTYIHTI